MPHRRQYAARWKPRSVRHHSLDPNDGDSTMTTRHAATFALLATACGLADPPASPPTAEVWTGVAVPVATSIDGAAASTASDTLWVFVAHERDDQARTVAATFTMWEADPAGCSLWWLTDRDSYCHYMTDAEGIGVPHHDPATRVLRFTLPVLGDCELYGWIVEAEDDDDPDVWRANLRCGELRRLYYTMNLSEDTGGAYWPR